MAMKRCGRKAAALFKLGGRVINYGGPPAFLPHLTRFDTDEVWLAFDESYQGWYDPCSWLPFEVK
jgi:hypothetical protein